MNELNYISKQLDLTLTTVENFSKTIIVDSMVQEQSTLHNQQKDLYNSIQIVYLKDKIGSIIQGTKFIQSVSLYDANKKLMVTTDTATTLPSMPNTHIQEPIWIPRDKTMPSTKTRNLPVISYITKYYNYEQGSLIGYIEISVYLSAITDIYKDQNNDPYITQLIVSEDGMTRTSDGIIKRHTLYQPFIDITPTPEGYEVTGNKILFYKYSPILNWYLVRSVDQRYFYRPIYSIFMMVALITLFCLLTVMLLSHFVAKTITNPIHYLIHHIQSVIHGNWRPVKEISASKEITFLTTEFNKMLMAQSKLKDDLIKEQIEKQKVSLNLLQQQVNPHFLYNALDNIYSLAELDEQEKLMEIVLNLSTFYQQTLNDGNFILTISKELSILESYLKIMQIRYYQKFDYVIECPPDLAKALCLKLLLQPIVENSIYHGIKEVSYKGKIHITVNCDDDSIIFTIDDNGKGMTDEALNSIWSHNQASFGLKNIHKRIQLYYGPQYGLWIGSNKDGGCRVLVRIGLQPNSEGEG